jgi:hypothetical protein
MSDTSGSLDQPPAVYGLVNGLLIRREQYNIEVYPELLVTAKEIIRLVEMAYELGIRRGIDEGVERGGDNDSDEQSPEY